MDLGSFDLVPWLVEGVGSADGVGAGSCCGTGSACPLRRSCAEPPLGSSEGFPLDGSSPCLLRRQLGLLQHQFLGKLLLPLQKINLTLNICRGVELSTPMDPDLKRNSELHEL